MRKNGVDPCIALTIQNAVSQMMIRTFDVVALDADTEDAARLIGLLLDLRHAKNTLLLMFPIGKSDVRAAFMNRGFDMCLAENSPKECSAAVCALLRRPSADEYPTEAAPPGAKGSQCAEVSSPLQLWSSSSSISWPAIPLSSFPGN